MSSKRLAKDLPASMDVGREHKVFYRTRDKIIMVDGFNTARVEYGYVEF